MTLLVLAVLCAIALPDLARLLDRLRASSVRQLLSADLSFARLNAIHRHADVGVCASLDGRHCADVQDWGRGWIVYLAQPGKHGPSESTDILAYRAWHPPAGWHIPSSIGRSRIRYLGSGRASGTNLSLQICHRDHLHGRVVINNAGRVRSETMDRAGACTR